MMKKKSLAAFLAGVLLLGAVSGCAGTGDSAAGSTGSGRDAVALESAFSGNTSEAESFPGESAARYSSSAGDMSGAESAGTESRSARPHPEDDPPMENPESCTLLIYMCGSTLESRQGAAGKDIDEMLSAELPGQVNIILETGGSKSWRSHGIANDRLQRYAIEEHSLKLLEEADNASMGDAETFAEFLTWGLTNYPADRTMLLLWDHGNNAAQGVCYDENYSLDCLDLSELSAAMEEAAKIRKLDVTIFDACLSANVETAFALRSSSRYMAASQVVVPSGGMDYAVLLEHALEPRTEEYGRLLCDSFMEACRKANTGKGAHMAFLKLSTAELLAFDLDAFFTHRLLPMPEEGSSGGDAGEASTESRDWIYENVYDERWVYRYTSEHTSVLQGVNEYNLLDLSRYVVKMQRYDYEEDLEHLQSDLEDLIVYTTGSTQYIPFADDPEYTIELCQGLSIYYPLKYDRAEVERYLDICPIPGYEDFLRYLFLDVPETGIAFADKGSVDQDGKFTISLTEESRYSLNEVGFSVWQQNPANPEESFLLGTNQIVVDPSNNLLGYTGNFDCEWYQMDGHWIQVDGVQDGGTYSLATPVTVNGADTEYHFSCHLGGDGRPVFEEGYLGETLDADGLVNREFSRLKKGDRVATTLRNDMEEFTVGEKGVQITAQPLPGGLYRYQFYATDLNNNVIRSNFVVFKVREKDGGRRVNVAEIIEANG